MLIPFYISSFFAALTVLYGLGVVLRDDESWYTRTVMRVCLFETAAFFVVGLTMIATVQA